MASPLSLYCSCTIVVHPRSSSDCSHNRLHLLCRYTVDTIVAPPCFPPPNRLYIFTASPLCSYRSHATILHLLSLDRYLQSLYLFALRQVIHAQSVCYLSLHVVHTQSLHLLFLHVVPTQSFHLPLFTLFMYYNHWPLSGCCWYKIIAPSLSSCSYTVTERCCCSCCCWLLLCSVILRSRADSLRSHVILHEWIAFYSVFLNIKIIACVCVCVCFRVRVLSLSLSL